MDVLRVVRKLNARDDPLSAIGSDTALHVVGGLAVDASEGMIAARGALYLNAVDVSPGVGSDAREACR